jgi:hypothetical protein
LQTFKDLDGIAVENGLSPGLCTFTGRQ